MKKKILVVLGSGGHTAQMVKLLKLLGDKYNYEYVINQDDKFSEKKIKGRVYFIPKPRIYGEFRLKRVPKSIIGLFKSIRIILKSNPHAIISAGPGLTFPLFIAGKLLRKKTIFIESWCRVNTPSLAGKLCYPLSDLFFVQWPEMKKHYPKAIYAGRLS